MAEEEYGDVSGWELPIRSSTAATEIADKLKPFLKITTDCGITDTKAACVVNKQYKQLNGNLHGGGNYTTRTDCYKIALLNGSSIWWKGPDEATRFITFWIDVNGKYLPNTYGKDLFVFVYEAGTNSIKPLGADKNDNYWQSSCKKTGNGWGCAYYVLQNQDMNYLH